ncbi:MAG TPA: FMN-binding protein [Gammaproteobacteria bacterium]|nr:FMN-binding protein [Gammaproteobacteria bacterium]
MLAINFSLRAHTWVSRGSLLLFSGLLAFWVTNAVARTHISTQEFLTQHFDEHIPSPKILWLTNELQRKATDLLDHPPHTMRLRYWQQGTKVAWVINEIGKEQPITFGIVVQDHKIESIQVLAFRESRGGEIRYPAYSQQFNGVKLTTNHRLDKEIDGITGATLSVRAMQRVARLALFASSVVADS